MSRPLFSLLAVVSIAAACGGQLEDAVDDRVKASATNGGRVDTSAPGKTVTCPLGIAAGAACGASQGTCTDDSKCNTPTYVCVGGVWRLQAESSCTVEQKNTCPTSAPSAEVW